MTQFYTFKEFCQILKANPNTVKTWKRRGDLPKNFSSKSVEHFMYSKMILKNG